MTEDKKTALIELLSREESRNFYGYPQRNIWNSTKRVMQKLFSFKNIGKKEKLRTFTTWCGLAHSHHRKIRDCPRALFS